MKRNPIFEGAATALITPTTALGVEYSALRRLIDWQIQSGIDGLVICGTTGEGATLTEEEHRKVLECAVDTAAGRVPIIAGTGSNNTARAIESTREACRIGCDAMLCVTPYYNKSTQKGLLAMYSAIADASDKPIIVYNVPSRTGVGIEPSTYLALSQHPNIAAVKEASGNLSQIMDTLSLVRDKLDLYSGNDDQIVPLLALGGKGVISVLSNLLPGETSRMCHMALEGDIPGALAMQLDFLPLIHALFSQVNPIPVKAAMAAMDFCEDYLRLPLVPLEDPQREVLYRCMEQAGIQISR